jgi:hypothetical protein
MSDQIHKEATVAADPSNSEKLMEGVLDKMDKGMPTFVVKGGGLWELWATATDLSQYRLNRYRDYDDMVSDSLIASALELVTDDACQFSKDRGATVWAGVGADKQWVQQALDTLQVEENIWGWTHNTALYGDFFPQLLIDKNVKGSKSGFKFRALDSSVHPREVRRLDIDGQLAGFLTQEEFSKVRNHAPWEFVHFMLNNRPRFERHRLKIRTEGTGSDYTKSDYTPDRSGKGKEVIATSTYGTSWLDPSRHVYRVLKLLEQSLALARLNRSPLIRVFYVNTTGMTPRERKETLDNLHHRFKESLSMDMRQNFYKSDYNPLSFNADLFIPVTDGVGQITAETLGGDLNIKDIVDVDYQKNKLFAALRIPQAYLGFEEAMPGQLGSTTLVRMDIRYARSVKKIQRAVLSGVTRLLEIMYALERGERPDPKKITVEMEVISGIEELDRMEAWSQKLGVAQQFLQMANDLEGKIEAKPLIQYVFDTVLGMKDISPDLKIGEGPAKKPDDADNEFASTLQNTMLQQLQEGEVNTEGLLSMIEQVGRKNYLHAAGRDRAHDFVAPTSEERPSYDFLEDVTREPMEEVPPEEGVDSDTEE